MRNLTVAHELRPLVTKYVHGVCFFCHWTSEDHRSRCRVKRVNLAFGPGYVCSWKLALGVVALAASQDKRCKRSNPTWEMVDAHQPGTGTQNYEAEACCRPLTHRVPMFDQRRTLMNDERAP